MANIRPIRRKAPLIDRISHIGHIKKVLLLGSGALQIGQAGEFDYSGSQAIKALKEEGIQVILINPNIATIQTSWGFADKVYFLPITPHFVEEVIKSQKPDGIFLSFGGQTALNCGLALEKSGVLKKHNVQILGSPILAIKTTEDRQAFAQMLAKIELLTPKSKAVKTVADAKKVAQNLGFPVMIRGGFSLGGQDSGVASNLGELEQIAKKALAKTPQILIEEYLAGWKEIEYEVVRDKFDNCITVCNMENIDPMGIHTGESVVVAPSQTLNNFEYHQLREIAIKVIRHLGIIGECNIQFALNPHPQPNGSRTAGQKHDGASLQIKNENNKLSVAGGGLSETENYKRTKNKNGRAFFDGGETTNLDYRIIEVNARLSRSSALASKATGYPLAYVAAKLGLGFSLTEIKNSVTKKTIAAFEPAMDYLVVKFPRWDLEKFVKSTNTIGSQMQSVGEVMAIGRKFEEALQKACRMLDIGAEGILIENHVDVNYKKPTPWRLFAIAKSLKDGVSTDKISKETKIDKFFLEKIKNITDFEKELETKNGLNKENLLGAKQLGFSDSRLAKLTGTTEDRLRATRHNLNVRPSVKQIDTLAAEYPAATNYLYLTYNGDKDDIEFAGGTSNANLQKDSRTAGQKHDGASLQIKNENNKLSVAGGGLSETENYKRTKNKNGRAFFDGGETTRHSVIVLGSGPYRIGSSVEFDWCSVTCAQTLRQNGVDPIIINCNPETVSTDYDMAKRLYFEELTAETVSEIYQKENPKGVIISMGGQTPNNLVLSLAKQKVKILGTSPASIDGAEDRHKFSKLCDTLGIDQPLWAKVKGIKDAVTFAQKIGFPVLVRPSYVLSGVAFNVAFNAPDLENYLKAASKVSEKYPVVISKFIEGAKEIEIDAVAREGKILTYAISEHVENAGVHSGDATLVLPPQKIYGQTEKQIEEIATQIAKSLKITGPFNMQFIAKDNRVLVIECNLRASRSLPFVSKITGVNFAELATQAILAIKTDLVPKKAYENLDFVGVKAPQFSFSRVQGADPVLRVEMASTGEVACFGADIEEAFLKSQIATGTKLPKKSVFISLGGDENKVKFLESARLLADLGLKIYATTGTSKFLTSHGIKNQKLHKIREGKKPTVVDYLTTKKIDLVINVFDPYEKEASGDGYIIRRTTIDWGIPLLTNLQTAELFAQAITTKKLADLKALPWESYVPI